MRRTGSVADGTLTQADTISLAQSGNPCLQGGGTYGTNGAGVLTVAGSHPVGGSSGFSGPSGIIPAGAWTYGALLILMALLNIVGARRLRRHDAG